MNRRARRRPLQRRSATGLWFVDVFERPGGWGSRHRVIPHPTKQRSPRTPSGESPLETMKKMPDLVSAGAFGLLPAAAIPVFFSILLSTATGLAPDLRAESETRSCAPPGPVAAAPFTSPWRPPRFVRTEPEPFPETPPERSAGETPAVAPEPPPAPVAPPPPRRFWAPRAREATRRRIPSSMRWRITAARWACLR